MKTSKEREEEFRLELNDLLAKHKAELEISSEGKPYGKHIGIAVITMMPVYDENETQTAEYTDFRI